MNNFKIIFTFFLIFCMNCYAQKSRIITTKDKDKNQKSNLDFSEKSTESNKNASKSNNEEKTIDLKEKNVIVIDSFAKKMPTQITDNLTLKKVDQDTIKPKFPEEIQVLVATSSVKVTREMVLAYIDLYKQIAKDEMVKYKIPSSITLAQGILESGSGTGALSMQANNHFGIKCHENWLGASVRYDDDEPDECFRKYEHPKKSFEDHSVFLKTRPWYNKLFKLPIDDYKGWAIGLKKAGYATDVKYPEKLIRIIESYNLTQFDNEVLGKENIETIETLEIKPKTRKEIEIPTEENPINVETKVEVKKDKIEIVETKIDNTNEKSSTSNSEVSTYTVLPKEGLYSISKKFNLTIEELKKLNNLTDNNISIGQVLKIK